MRLKILFLLSILSSCSFSQNSRIEKLSTQDEDILGEWILDLRPSPDADPYYQTLIIYSEGEKSLTGSFYGSSIQNLFLNEKWDKLYFAFKTSDESSEYYQSGYIVGNSVFGITYCPERNFVMPWTGKKKLED